jgi:hypothetical protein
MVPADPRRMHYIAGQAYPERLVESFRRALPGRMPQRHAVLDAVQGAQRHQLIMEGGYADRCQPPGLLRGIGLALCRWPCTARFYEFSVPICRRLPGN